MAYGLEVYNSSGTLCFSNSDLFTRIAHPPFSYTLIPGQTSQKFYVPGVHDTASQPNKKLVQVAVMPLPGNNAFTPPTETQTGVDSTGDWFTLSNPNTQQGASAANSSGWCFVLRRG